MSNDNVVQIILKALGGDQVKGEMGKIGTAFKGLKSRTSELRSTIFSLKSAFLGIGAGWLAKSFIDDASKVEKFRITLNKLLGDVEEGNKLLYDMAEFAGKVPYEYEKIMAAAVSLSGVMENGREEIKQWMPVITDIAATWNMSLEDTTSQIIRMYSSGAASADTFRERGILAALGFQAGVSYSAEETRKILMEAWEDPASKFRGVTADLAKNWDGLVSMLMDKWFQFKVTLMDSAPYDYLKASLAVINDELDLNADNTKEYARKIGEQIIDLADALIFGIAGVIDTFNPIIKSVWTNIKGMWNAFISLDPTVQEFGIIGFILGGKKLKWFLAAILVLLDKIDIEQRMKEWKAVDIVEDLDEKGLINKKDVEEQYGGFLNQAEALDYVQKLIDNGVLAEDVLNDVQGALKGLGDVEIKDSGLTKHLEDWKEKVKKKLADLQSNDGESVPSSKAGGIKTNSGSKSTMADSHVDEWDEYKKKQLEAYGQIKHFSEGYHLFREKQLDDIAQKMREVGIEEADITRWKADETRKIDREQYEHQLQNASSFKDAFTAKLNLMRMDAKTIYQDMADEFAGVFDQMKGHLEGFFDYQSDKFMQFGDLAKSILHDVYMAFMRAAIINPLVNGIMGSISGFAGGGAGANPAGLQAGGAQVAHNGGKIIPRFHAGGLNRDEQLVVSKVDERYINNEQDQWLTNIANAMNNGGGAPNISINIENQTGQPVDAKAGNMKFDGEKWVLGIIMKNYSEYGFVRQITGAR